MALGSEARRRLDGETRDLAFTPRLPPPTGASGESGTGSERGGTGEVWGEPQRDPSGRSPRVDTRRKPVPETNRLDLRPRGGWDEASPAVAGPGDREVTVADREVPVSQPGGWTSSDKRGPGPRRNLPVPLGRGLWDPRPLPFPVRPFPYTCR